MSKVKQWLCTRLGLTGLSGRKPQQGLNTPVMYRSITQLPLHRYIDADVDGNLHALVITGKPTDEELQTAWGEITEQVSEIGGGAEYKLYMSLFKEIAIYDLTLKQIEYLVSVLQYAYSRSLCDELNKIGGTSFKLDPTDNQTYQEELKRCLRRSGGMKIKMDLKVAQFEAMQKKFEGKKTKPTREFYQAVLNNLSDHAKYLVPDTITVYQYYDRLKRLNQYYEAQKSQKA